MSPSQGERSQYYLRTAKIIAEEVQFSLQRNEYDRVVRKTQEAIEMLLKAKILQQGLEPAKTHDLRDLAGILHGEKLPVGMAELIYLSEERIPAFYGSADFIPDKEYDQQDGDRCRGILEKFGLLKK